MAGWTLDEQAITNLGYQCVKDSSKIKFLGGVDYGNHKINPRVNVKVRNVSRDMTARYPWCPTVCSSPVVPSVHSVYSPPPRGFLEMS